MKVDVREHVENDKLFFLIKRARLVVLSERRARQTDRQTDRTSMWKSWI